MADQLLDQVRDLFEGQIDFEGQRLAELMTTVVLAVAGLAAFLVGYIQQDVYLTAYVGLGGTALAFLLIVPPWPFFNRNPVNWLPPSNSISGFDISVDGKKLS